MNGQTNRLTRFLFFGFLGLALIAARPVTLQEQARVTVVHPTGSFEVGENVSIAVVVSDAMDVFGIEIHASFDPSILQVRDADETTQGIQVMPGDFLSIGDGFLVANRVDNDTGEIVFALTLLAPAEPVSGSGELMVLEFNAAGLGSSPFSLDSVILVTQDGLALPVAIESGTLTVGDEGQGSVPAATRQAEPPQVPGSATETAVNPDNPSPPGSQAQPAAITMASEAATASAGISTTVEAQETQADSAGDGTAGQIITNEDSSSSEFTDEVRETRARVETTEEGESVPGERTTDLADGPVISENTGVDGLSEELAAGLGNRSTLVERNPQDEDTTALLFALMFVVIAMVALFIWLGRRSRKA